MKLKLIGYWFDPDAKNIYPNPKDLVDPLWHPEMREKIASYLLNGTVFENSWGHSYCRFEDGPPVEEMGSADLTDGVFVWPQGLHVYVSRYNVVLPEEFVERVRAGNPKVPSNVWVVPMKAVPFAKKLKDSGQVRIEGAEIDEDYWVAWAANYKAARDPQ